MGKNNKARRAAKARQRARQRAQGGPRRRPEPQHDAGPVFSEAERAELAWLTAAGVGIGRRMADQETGLAQLRRLAQPIVWSVGERLLLDHIGVLWDNGWQPRELHRQARLGGRPSVVVRVVELAVAVECARQLAGGVPLDPSWREQADELASGVDPTTGWLAAAADGSYVVALDAFPVLFELPALDVLIPPPGRTDAPGTRRPAAATDPMLQRVRSLLAKAESTEFEAEAIALTAKAQELITRHAIDAALLAGEAGAGGPADEPGMIRVPIDPPYADAKSLLLQIVAEATRCRSVFSPGVSHSSVVGFPDDLAAVELLFTSLLVQAQHALAEAGRSAPAGTRTRSQGFRSAFLLAYAHRIGERLDEINQHVFAAEERAADTFLPVLRSQEEAVADFLAARFGQTYAGSVRGAYDPAGWTSGRLAADQARLAAGDLDATA